MKLYRDFSIYEGFDADKIKSKFCDALEYLEEDAGEQGAVIDWTSLSIGTEELEIMDTTTSGQKLVQGHTNVFLSVRAAKRGK